MFEPNASILTVEGSCMDVSCCSFLHKPGFSAGHTAMAGDTSMADAVRAAVGLWWEECEIFEVWLLSGTTAALLTGNFSFI